MNGLNENIRDVIKDFSGTAPILPLKDAVLFPGTFLPLHISEEQDKALIADAESGSRLVCVALYQQDRFNKSPYHEADMPERSNEIEIFPPIHSVGTLSYLDKLKIGTYGTCDNLLLGLTKVYIQEVETNTPYRMGKLTFIEESKGEGNLLSLKKKIFRQFGHLLEDSRFLSLADYVQDGFDFELVVNMIAAQLPVELEEQQKLLELDDLSIRAQVLLQFMDTEFRDIANYSDTIHGDLRMN